MTACDRGTSLFWLAFALAVLIESARLGVGTLGDPGTGFVTAGAAGLLAVLSLILFGKTIVAGGKGEESHVFVGTLWPRVLLVLIALGLYAKLMPIAGYLLSTFCLMTVLFWLVKGQRWWSVIASSLAATVGTYYLFSVLLKCNYPPGFLCW